LTSEAVLESIPARAVHPNCFHELAQAIQENWALRDANGDEGLPKTSLTEKRNNVEADSSTVNVELSSELIEKLTAASKASGQSKSDWIRDAIAEAMARRRKRKAH
jgi:hypothetical protein